MRRFSKSALIAACLLAWSGLGRGAVPLPPDPFAVFGAGQSLLALTQDQQLWRRDRRDGADWRIVPPPPGEEAFKVTTLSCATDNSGLCLVTRSDGRTNHVDLLEADGGAVRPFPLDGEVDTVVDRGLAYVVRRGSDGRRDLYRYRLDNSTAIHVGAVQPDEAITYLRIDGVVTPLARTIFGSFREIADQPNDPAFHLGDFENLVATPEGSLVIETWAHTPPVKDGVRSLADLRVVRGSKDGRPSLEPKGEWFFGFPTSGPVAAPGRAAADANNDIVLELVGAEKHQLGILCRTETGPGFKVLVDMPANQNTQVSGGASASGFVLTGRGIGHTPSVQMLNLSPSPPGGWRTRSCGATAATLVDANVAVRQDASLEIGIGEAVSADGTKVPYVIVISKGAKPEHAIIDVYGAFGARRDLSDYQPATKKLLMDTKTAIVFPTVRGDGDKGFDWAMASATPNRQRAVDDVIAVAKAVAARLPSLKDRPTVRGASAGGWLAVKAALQKPDLFSGAIGYSGAYLLAGDPLSERNTQRFFDPQVDDLAKDAAALGGNCHGLHFRLLHARDDEKIPFASAEAFAGQLKAQHCEVEEVAFDRGGHAIALDMNQEADAERRLKAYFTPF